MPNCHVGHGRPALFAIGPRWEGDGRYVCGETHFFFSRSVHARGLPLQFDLAKPGAGNEATIDPRTGDTQLQLVLTTTRVGEDIISPSACAEKGRQQAGATGRRLTGLLVNFFGAVCARVWTCTGYPERRRAETGGQDPSRIRSRLDCNGGWLCLECELARRRRRRRRRRRVLARRRRSWGEAGCWDWRTATLSRHYPFRIGKQKFLKDHHSSLRTSPGP
jgi:hypothetical protein